MIDKHHGLTGFSSPRHISAMSDGRTQHGPRSGCVYDGGGLRYAGNVGTGFTEAMLADLMERLRPLVRDISPFGTAVPARPARDARWVEPRLMGEVAFTEWTVDLVLRHPRWRGLRAGQEPGEVGRKG
jgi:bifunctional non-homologous end joining protein LigD